MAENQKKEVEKLSDEEIDLCISVLETLTDDPNQIFEIEKDKRLELIMAAGKLSRPSREEFRKRKKDAKRANKRKLKEKDRHARNSTGIRSAREAVVFEAPKMIGLTGKESEKEIPLESPRNCYVCKEVFHNLHHFYDTMCKGCGDFNYAKRFQNADLTDLLLAFPSIPLYDSPKKMISRNGDTALKFMALICDISQV